MANGNLPQIDVIWLSGAPYTRNILFSSDLHKDLIPALDYLQGLIDPAEWIFISAGDMAGTDQFGEDASPSKGYQRILDAYKAFYYVAGNHDILEPEILEMTNNDGSPCNLSGRTVQIGDHVFGGVGGIIGNEKKLNRLSLENFERTLKKLHKVNTLIAHQPVSVSRFEPKLSSSGLEPSIERMAPIINVFGHARLDPVWVAHGDTTYLNADGRILLL